ncbi:MAG: cellulose biosynthesis cyclic di-GMP-binding regulatory protein BcsB, partial [Beijerinckiaceae bacterium]
FKVGYLSAVSVMPEASRLKLVINDTIIGIANIYPTRGSRTIVFDVPPGLIEPGFNSVRLTAEQRHRVDCSISSTYELWTQIDPTRTGFVFPSNDEGVTRLADLPALPPDNQGALPIRVVSPAKTTTAQIERLMRAVQRITLLGRFEQPVTDVGPLAKGQYGINLVIGTIEEIGPIARTLGVGAVAGPRVILLPVRNDYRTTIVVTGRTQEDLDFALMQIIPDKTPPGSKAGLRAIHAYPGYRIKGGERVKLRDMGMASEEFSGRLYKAAFNVIMPPDFYAADYGKAYLDLAGGYAPGLTNAAQIVVSVNGRNAVSMKLPKSSGDVFKQSPIPLRLGHLRPGLNRIELEAQVPVPEDKACDPLAVIGGRNRFLLLETTEFVLPEIARIARSPDLAVTTTGAFPFVGTGDRPILFVPHADSAAISAAATLASHLAIAGGDVIDFRFTTKRPENGSGATLVIAPHTTIDSKLVTALGLSPETLHSIWGKRVKDRPDSGREEDLTRWERITKERLILQRNFPAACHMRQPPGGYKTAFMMDMTPVAAIENEPGKRDLFEEWDQRIRSQSKIMGYVSGFIKGVSDWTQGKFSVARIWIGSQIDASEEESPMNESASLILAQNIIGKSSKNIWTLISAPNTGLLNQAVGCLVDPRVWQQINGKIAVLNASEGSVAVIPVTDSTLIPTQPLSVANLRLIVAGWFSLNSKIYVLCALLIAFLLALSTNWFVRNAGRKT